MKKVLLPLFFVSFLSACGGEPTIDFSSKAATQGSVKKMKENLSLEDSKRLDRAIMKIGMQAAFVSGDDEQKMQNLLKEKLKGKTAKQIIALDEKK
ncbi:hypothetical protein B5C26_21175 [Photorhabdus luminescens]|uniref:DUF6694 family lipoprotein n=1 Tax=Photorhabdus luminescens TaxID=29488 RepID=UPI000B4CFF21|nr:DUF6694 family lipoprotein [Photorhabdus luminescens]OWO79292.1 hypothetical protein B5C26_21175 [Photorhabdus luminescens]